MRRGDVVARTDREDRHLLVLTNSQYHQRHELALVTPLFATPGGADPAAETLATLSPYPAYLTPRRLWPVPIDLVGETVGTAEPSVVALIVDDLMNGLQPE